MATPQEKDVLRSGVTEALSCPGRGGTKHAGNAVLLQLLDLQGCCSAREGQITWICLCSYKEHRGTESWGVWAREMWQHEAV